MTIAKNRFNPFLWKMCILTFSFALLRTVGGQELIVNGGFETGDYSGWNESGSAGIGILNGNSCCNPFEGNHYANFNGSDLPTDGEISQVFPSVCGTRYELNLAFGKGGIGGGTSALIIQVSGTQTLLDAEVSDSSGGLPGGYEPFHFLFVADSSSTEIRILDLSSGTISFDGMLDCVSVIADMSVLGDVNQDNTVNLLDVAPFVELLSTSEFQIEADINCDGLVNLLDVQPFVALLSV